MKVRTRDSKDTYKAIKTLLISHPSQRDGGIFNTYLDDYDKIVSGSRVMRNCLNVLANVSREQPSCGLGSPI